MAILGYKTRAEKNYETLTSDYRKVVAENGDLLSAVDGAEQRASRLREERNQAVDVAVEKTQALNELVQSTVELQAAVLADFEIGLNESLTDVYDGIDRFLNVGTGAEGVLEVIARYLVDGERAVIEVGTTPDGQIATAPVFAEPVQNNEDLCDCGLTVSECDILLAEEAAYEEAELVG